MKKHFNNLKKGVLHVVFLSIQTALFLFICVCIFYTTYNAVVPSWLHYRQITEQEAIFIVIGVKSLL